MKFGYNIASNQQAVSPAILAASNAPCQIVKRAKQRGLWIHMGRVNGSRRTKYAAALGCDSVDGSSTARFMQDKLTSLIPYHIYKQKELIA